METKRFEQEMALLARKYGLHLSWQDLKFGYRRARFACDTYDEMAAVLNLLWHTGRSLGGSLGLF